VLSKQEHDVFGAAGVNVLLLSSAGIHLQLLDFD